MNVEARRLSSSDSSDDNQEITVDVDVESIGASEKSDSSFEKIIYSPDSDSEPSPASFSDSHESEGEGRIPTPTEGLGDTKQDKEVIFPSPRSRSSSSSSRSIEEESPTIEQALKQEQKSSDSGSSIAEKPDYASSITESDQGLLKSILSDSSSEKIVTDIEITSPKDGKFSSSTDDELLRKFREQQANRRFRPRSAKFRRDADPEPESVQRVQSRASDRGSSKEASYSSDSSNANGDDSLARRRRPKKPRKGSASSGSKSNASKKSDSSRSPSPSSSTHSSDNDKSKEPPAKPVEEQLLVQATTTAESGTKKTATTETETRYSLTTGPTSQSESTFIERPPSRQGERPKSTRPGRARTRTKPDRSKYLRQQLKKKSEPLPVDSPSNWPQEPGFWWPYNEDSRGERELQRLIEYHRRKLHNLLAQEYLQRHLELELRKAGAQFKQYERGPRPLSPKQVRKFKERNVTWIFLDGKLHNLNNNMGNWNQKARGRNRNKVTPNKSARAAKSISRERSSKSSDRSKRSVSFEKGVGRRRSSAPSAERNPLTNLIRGLSPKRKKKRKGSGSSKGSRKSSLSSRGSARTLSRSSSRTSQSESKIGKRTKSSSEASRSRSRSSSRVRKYESTEKSPKRPKTATRPKTAKAKSRPRSVSSASKSSAERNSSKESGKKQKDRSSSRSGSDKKRSKSKDSSIHKSKNKHYGIDENPKLERVIFTEDFERKLRRQQKKKDTINLTLPPRENSTKPHDKESVPPLEKKRVRPRTADTARERHLQDDYNIYKDPNIPGHAFPYHYLTYLLSMERGRKKKHGNESPDMVKLVLKPAPVNKPPAWRTYSAKSRRPVPTLPQARRSPASSPTSRRKRKTKSVINETHADDKERSSSRESKSSSMNQTSSTMSYPRIRPGSGPIKCSWKAQTEPEKPKYPGSDHQLKNTDNPAILAWLRRKDAQLRARRQNEIRKQRRKTAKLIDEQNDLEEKHERALEQYEMWKKNKDREILLRRRKEAKEASSATFAKKENELKTTKRKERPRTANSQQKSVGGSTFSELRSSSASPNTVDKPKSRKSRPKSANTIGVSFSDQIEVTHNQRPRSATPPRKSSHEETKHHQSVFQKTENFFKSFLGVGSQSTNTSKTVATEQTDTPVQQQPVVVEDKAAYDKWVRSSTPTNKNSPKGNGKKKSKGSPTRNRKKGRGVSLPPHNHTDNDLISNLAKRRIESILASRQRVDTGLKKRPKSGTNGVKNPSPPQGSRTDPTHRKWKLREDDVIKPQVVKFNSQNSINESSSSSSSSDGKSDEARPKFSYKKKSTSTSTSHERNPVVRDAVAGK